MEDFIMYMVQTLVQMFIAGVGTVVIVKVIPWLKQLGIYSLIKICVQAAEKLAETQQISKEKKKEYVENTLKSFGIEITPLVDTMIESAVKELDIQADKIADEILKE